MVVACILLSSCKATSSIQITMESKASPNGIFKLSIVFDDEAASIIRGDAYKPIDLSSIFKLGDFKSAGFSTTQDDNSIEIRRSFNTSDELNEILKAVAGDGIFTSRIKNENSLLSEKRTVIIDVKLDKLKDAYLNSVEIKESLIAAGVEFADYETLINEAFDSTTLQVILKDSFSGKSVSKDFKGSELKNDSLVASGDKTRTEFLLGNLGALVCLTLAIFLAIRKWHTPKLISTSEQN